MLVIRGLFGLDEADDEADEDEEDDEDELTNEPVRFLNRVCGCAGGGNGGGCFAVVVFVVARLSI